jgi:hypothetical protein
VFSVQGVPRVLAAATGSKHSVQCTGCSTCPGGCYRQSLADNFCADRMFVYTTTHCSLKAYCAILVRRSNFRHQASLRVSLHESTPAAEGGTVGEKCPVILPKFRITRYIYGSLTCRKSTTLDRRLYFPSEGRRAEDFFALKI